MKPRITLAVAAVVAFLPLAARAHGVAMDVERQGAEVAVRARYAGGRPLAGATYEVLAPGRSDRAHEAGVTDKHGWLVFVPDAPGTWTVRVADASGHGGVARVNVEPAAAAPTSAPVAAAPAAPPEAAPEKASTTPAARAPLHPALRVAGSVLAIALVFGVLFAVQRRRRAARP